jgi:hypothetical protein
MVVGIIYYRYDSSPSLSWAEAFYMSVNVGFCIGLEHPRSNDTNDDYRVYSMFYMVASSTLIVLALQVYAKSALMASKRWHVDVLSLRDNKNGRGVRFGASLTQLAWLHRHFIVCVSLVLVWLISVAIFGHLATGLAIMESLYFAVSCACAGGLISMPLSSTNDDYAAMACFLLIGVPLFGTFLSYVGFQMVPHGHIPQTRRVFFDDISDDELRTLRSLGVSYGSANKGFSRSDYALLCLMRMRAIDPGTAKAISERYTSLSAPSDDHDAKDAKRSNAKGRDMKEYAYRRKKKKPEPVNGRFYKDQIAIGNGHSNNVDSRQMPASVGGDSVESVELGWSHYINDEIRLLSALKEENEKQVEREQKEHRPYQAVTAEASDVTDELQTCEGKFEEGKASHIGVETANRNCLGGSSSPYRAPSLDSMSKVIMKARIEASSQPCLDSLSSPIAAEGMKEHTDTEPPGVVRDIFDIVKSEITQRDQRANLSPRSPRRVQLEDLDTWIRRPPRYYARGASKVSVKRGAEDFTDDRRRHADEKGHSGRKSGDAAVVPVDPVSAILQHLKYNSSAVSTTNAAVSAGRVVKDSGENKHIDDPYLHTARDSHGEVPAISATPGKPGDLPESVESKPVIRSAAPDGKTVLTKELKSSQDVDDGKSYLDAKNLDINMKTRDVFAEARRAAAW